MNKEKSIVFVNSQRPEDTFVVENLTTLQDEIAVIDELLFRAEEAFLFTVGSCF